MVMTAPHISWCYSWDKSFAQDPWFWKLLKLSVLLTARKVSQYVCQLIINMYIFSAGNNILLGNQWNWS